MPLGIHWSFHSPACLRQGRVTLIECRSPVGILNGCKLFIQKALCCGSYLAICQGARPYANICNILYHQIPEESSLQITMPSNQTRRVAQEAKNNVSKPACRLTSGGCLTKTSRPLTRISEFGLSIHIAGRMEYVAKAKPSLSCVNRVSELSVLFSRNFNYD